MGSKGKKGSGDRKKASVDGEQGEVERRWGLMTEKISLAKMRKLGQGGGIDLGQTPSFVMGSISWSLIPRLLRALCSFWKISR